MGTKLVVSLKVKFRFLGITLGTVSQNWSEPLPAFIPDRVIVNFADRGISLIISTQSGVLPPSGPV